MRRTLARLSLTIAGSLAVLASSDVCSANAQEFTRPWLEWRTLRTTHFDVHYPAEADAWTREMASRLEGTWQAVGMVVGSTPAQRVTIVVEDPSVQANGTAYPFLDQPTIVMWPTPPDPRSQIGNHRGFSEQLEVHEFTHLAHLTRPSRNPLERFVWRVLPVRFGPVARRSPRWVAEGYATYVEGKVTGSGRPHSAVRAAVLREWALEGKLPTYGQLSGAGTFQGMSMAYLGGSAFLEWLADRKGEQSLVNLWRRLSARQERTFAEAFAGVFGGYPHDLYGQFTVDVTARALEARRRLTAAGIEAGTPVQKLNWATGDPAVSPDGKNLAVVLRGAPGVPSRVVIWNTRDEPEDSATIRARRRMVQKDPEDVPAIDWRPRPKRALATLYAVAGRGHDEPRFLPDGKHVLVTRSEPTAGWAMRPDLFVWGWKDHTLRRLTHGAAILSADPLPDGRAAVGVRCVGGACDLVRVDLASGRAMLIARGTPDLVFDRPRVSPDGRMAAVSAHAGGRWRIALVSLSTGDVRFVDPEDGASRYDPAWLDGETLVDVSELGGVSNLERLSLEGASVRPLTRVTGGAFAPEPDSAVHGIFFLNLHAGGYDLNRIDPDSAAAAVRQVVALGPELAPAAPPAAVNADTLPRNTLAGPTPYSLGPRRLRALPAGTVDPNGATVGVMLGSVDPVGRLTLTVRGVVGQQGAERGGALGFAWRGWRPAVVGNLAWSRRDASRGSAASPVELDGDVWGGGAWIDQPVFGSAASQRVRAGGWLGSVDLAGSADGGSMSRRLVFGEYTASVTHTRGRGASSVGLTLHAATGSTGGERWNRGRATLGVAAAGGGLSVRGQATYGMVSAATPAWERFAVGGSESALLDPSLLSQRIAMPGLPLGTLSGSRVLVVRGSTRFGALTPYYWAASTDHRFQRWHRVIGLEADTELPSATLLSVPALRFRAGTSYSLDAPWRHRASLYAQVVYRP